LAQACGSKSMTTSARSESSCDMPCSSEDDSSPSSCTDVDIWGYCHQASASSGESLRVLRQRRSFRLHATLSSGQHPLTLHPDLLSCIQLLRKEAFFALPSPMPRCQDVPAELFGPPEQNDIVIAVSHAWRNQTHPDPCGCKLEVLQALLERVPNWDEGKALVFFDFLSIPQRPFSAGQRARTAEESARFREALRCMHNMYFFADCIVHLGSSGEEVEGEGVEYTVSASDLKDAAFNEVGGWVQVAGLESEGQADFAHPFAHCFCNVDSRVHPWAPFDRVLTVNGEEIRSVKQLQERMSVEDEEAPCVVTLCRYPFGKVNLVPPDQRGWVFLERFITAVKCAMLDEDQAAEVVISDSDYIRDQIDAYADRLRQAARSDERHRLADNVSAPPDSALKRLLHEFLMELSEKQFSAASTDKLLIDTHAQKHQMPDSKIVAGIMEEFVEHLGEHWSDEAVRQQHLADRRATAWRAARAYLLHWDHFSDDYMSRLDVASTSAPGPFMKLAVLPPLLALLCYLAPFAEPSELGPLLNTQALFWFYGDPLAAFVCWYLLPMFWSGIVRLQSSWMLEVKLFLWTLGVTSLVVCISFAASKALGVFPVPLTALIQTTVGACFLPLLWWCAPWEQRADPMFRLRTGYGFLASLAIVVCFAMGLPFITMALVRTQQWWQHALIVSCFLVVKLSFQRIGGELSKRLGADCMPCFIFLAKLCYEFNLCMALSTRGGWFVFIELVAFDAAENLYHLWSLLRTDVGKVSDSTDTRARQHYIVATLLLHECAEIFTLGQFIFEVFALRVIQPKLNSLVCAASQDEYYQMELFLLFSFGVELLIISANYCALRLRGFKPLLLLRGLLATNLPAFLASACAVHMYYIMCQHTHFGMDMTLNFKWLRDPGAQWQCGLEWI